VVVEVGLTVLVGLVVVVVPVGVVAVVVVEVGLEVVVVVDVVLVVEEAWLQPTRISDRTTRTPIANHKLVRFILYLLLYYLGQPDS
jgi:hypothetical protein